MFKLLIVDDEPLVQAGMQSMLDYSALDISVCGVAANGEMALAMIRELHPEIVIIDIKMPLRTGLEVIEVTVGELGGDVPEFVVLTGFDDFEYARRAMRLGVGDFLLKLELDREVLTGCLQKVIARLQERGIREDGFPDVLEMQRSALADRFFSKLLNNWFEDEEEMEEMRRDVAPEFQGGCYAVLHCRITDSTVTGGHSALLLYTSNILRGICSRYFPCHVTQWDLGSLVIACALEGEDEGADSLGECIRQLQDAVHRYLNVRLLAGVSSCTGDLMQLPTCLNEGRIACQGCDGGKPVVYFDRIIGEKPYRRTFHISLVAGTLAQAFASYDTEAIERCLGEIAQLFLEHCRQPEQAIAMCSSILHFVIVSFHDGQELVGSIFHSEEDPFCDLQSLGDVSQAVAWLQTLKAGLVKRVKHDFELSRNWLVPSIKAYIEEHYNERLSLSDVAKAFDVSAGYVSALFKKYNDTGFSECVTQAKISRAQQLLCNTEYRIHEISNMLGYSDPYYFSKVFKKTTGMAPREYLLRQKNRV